MSIRKTESGGVARTAPIYRRTPNGRAVDLTIYAYSDRNWWINVGGSSGPYRLSGVGTKELAGALAELGVVIGETMPSWGEER